MSILTYGSEVKDLDQREFLKLNTAVNMYIRKIFSFKWWQGTRFIRDHLGYHSLTVIFEAARKRFLRSIANSSNSVLKKLYDIFEK